MFLLKTRPSASTRQVTLRSPTFPVLVTHSPLTVSVGPTGRCVSSMALHHAAGELESRSLPERLHSRLPSSAGYCGNGEQYCGKSTCQEDYGKCQSNDPTLDFPACSWASAGTSPRCDGKCGSAYNNAVCAQGVAADAFAQLGVYDYGPCCSKGG